MKSSGTYPTISIGIPTYNGGEGILKALNSVWKQNYPQLEIIISDNCSTDNTETFVRGLCEIHPEIRYFRQAKNIGIHANFTFVLAQATSRYFMWLSDDDELESDLFWRYTEFLEKNPDYVTATGQIRYWKNNEIVNLEHFNLDQENPRKRFIKYYLNVRWGGMYHGLMRTQAVQTLPSKTVYGYDYHLVANLAYLGKIRTFDFVGYNKYAGGSSQDRSKYAQHVNERKWVGKLPFIKIAMDAYKEVQHSPTFSKLPPGARVRLGLSAFGAVLLNNYPLFYLDVLWGKIKKMIASKNQEIPSSSVR